MKRYESLKIILSLMEKDVITGSDDAMVKDMFEGESNPWDSFHQ